MKRIISNAVLLACLVANGCGGEPAESRRESMIERVLRRGELHVGLSAYTPWAMKGKNGEWIGLEVDIARELAENMGVKPVLIGTQWSGIIPSLLSGKFDIIISGMVMTIERNMKVNFTQPAYAYSGLHLTANKKLTAGFDELSDFNRPEVTVSCLTGSNWQADLKKILSKVKLTTYETNAQLIQAVIAGHSHAFAQVEPTPRLAVLRNPDTLVLPFEKPLTPRKFAVFAVAKGDHDSLNFLNNWISQKKEDGWLEERKRYWFESIDWENRLP